MFEIYYTVNNTEFFVLLRKSFGVLAQHINIISLFTSAQLSSPISTRITRQLKLTGLKNQA
jgi:hypothetical protein